MGFETQPDDTSEGIPTIALIGTEEDPDSTLLLVPDEGAQDDGGEIELLPYG